MSSEDRFRLPKEQDFLKLLETADKEGYLNKNVEEEKANKKPLKNVTNPLSFLKYSPLAAPVMRRLAEDDQIRISQGKKPLTFPPEKEDEIDYINELDRAIIGGSVKAIKSVSEFITAGIDKRLDTDLTTSVDKATNRFLKQHGNPKTFAGEIAEVGTQFALPGGIIFKMIGKVGQLNKLKNIGKLTNYLSKTKAGKTGIKLSEKAAKLAEKSALARGVGNISRRAGQGGLAFGITDFAFSDSSRELIFSKKIDETGLRGKELAEARLANKKKFAIEGAQLGAGINAGLPLLGLGLKYGLLKPGAATIGATLKAGNKLIVNPVVKLASKDPYVLPSIAKALQQNANVAGEIGTRILLPFVSGFKVGGLTRIKEGLPAFKDWRMFSTESVDPLRVALKRIDNGLAYLRSIGRDTPEISAVALQGQKTIVANARVLDKLLESLEKRAYDLAKANEKLYNTKTTSPALLDKYLDDVLSFFEGKTSLKTIPKELQPVAKAMQKILMKTKETFTKLLPEDSLIKPALEKNIKGYLRKSFSVFTNPNYAVNESSEIFKNATKFVLNVINKNTDLIATAKSNAKRDGITLSQAKQQLAKDQINDILRAAKTDNKDPIQILTEISKKKLKSDKVLVSGEELPEVIRKVLGEERNVRNVVLQTIANLSTQSANKMMFDRMGEVMLRQGVLFKTAEEAASALRMLPDQLGSTITRVGRIKGLGLLQSETSNLYGPLDVIQRMTNLKGPLDFLAEIPLYKNFLQFKVGIQYGKTVLSPPTQTRNFSSAGMFVLNRGLIGGRASVTDSIKMVVDDIFNAGKGSIDDELKLITNINEGIVRGALDENIVAAELGAVLRAIRKNQIRDTDQLTKYLETNGLMKTLNRVYAGGDNVWKWYAYNWYKSFLNDYSQYSLPRMQKWFDEIANEKFNPLNNDGTKKTLQDAIEEASAWYVRNTMPTYSMVPRFIQGWRSTPFGNFIAFPAEMLRTSANTLQVNMREMASSDPVLREMGNRGLMGQFVTMGGASYAIKGIAAATTGVTNAMIDNYKAYVAPDFQRNNDLVAISKVNEEGTFKVVDLSSFLPYDFVTKGFEAAINKIQKQKMNPQQTNKFVADLMFAKDGVLWEMVSPFLDQSIALETFGELFTNKKKQGGQIWSELADVSEIFNKGLDHVWKKIQPGAVPFAKQVYYGFREQLTPKGRSYDLEDTLLGLGTGVKPLTVDLENSTNFFLNDFKSIRREASNTSPMYNLNQPKDDIKKEFIDIQRKAWREQQRIKSAFQTMIDMGMDEDIIYDRAKVSKVPSKQLDLLLDSEFRPVTYSKPRFEQNIERLEKNLEKTRRGIVFIDEDKFFPEDELDDIIDTLEDADLNGPFPYDIPKKPAVEPVSNLNVPSANAVSQAPAKPVTPPLPKTPTPVLAAQANPISATGLTNTEMALLSPSEQAIRLRQRG